MTNFQKIGKNLIFSKTQIAFGRGDETDHHERSQKWSIRSDDVRLLCFIFLNREVEISTKFLLLLRLPPFVWFFIDDISVFFGMRDVKLI